MKINELKKCFGWMKKYNHLVFFSISRTSGQVSYYQNSITDLPFPVSLHSWEGCVREEDRKSFKFAMEKAVKKGEAMVKYKISPQNGDDFLTVQQRIYFVEETNTFTGMLVDISHMEKKEVLARQANEERYDVEKVIYEAAHDLRSPLKSVSGLVNLMETEMNSLRNNSTREKMLGYLKKLNDITNFSISVASSLLTMSKLKKENALPLKPVRPVPFMESYAKVLKTIFPEREIQLVIQGGVSSELHVNINITGIKRAIINLVANACKFSPEGVPVVIGVRELMNRLEIYVKDGGVGMPVEQMENIFSPDACTGRIGINGEQSFGLGLALVKKIVDLHEGNVVVNSEEGKGSTFSIVLKKYFILNHIETVPEIIG